MDLNALSYEQFFLSFGILKFLIPHKKGYIMLETPLRTERLEIVVLFLICKANL